HRLCRQIDRELIAWLCLDLFKELGDLLRFEHYRQHAVHETVVEEDVSETRRDDGTKTVIMQSPRSVLAGGSTAKVVTGQEDRRSLVTWLVEKESFISGAISAVTPVREQAFAQAGALNGFQVLFRNDLVGINVNAIEWSNQTLED